jgi:integrase
LRKALLERQLAAGRPAPDQAVLPHADPANFVHRHWSRTCVAAKLGHRRPKDCRDSFASHLLSAGVQLGYISRQLGHSSVAITATSYARWCGGDTYRAPIALEPGELPCDLLARLPKASETSDLQTVQAAS